MRRTKEESAKTKEKILDISLMVFGQKGYGATKLSDIAKEANITRGAIYHHFKNKTELFDALIDRYHNKFEKAIEPIIDSDDNIINKLKKSFDKYFTLLENDKGMLEFEKVQFSKQELNSSSKEIKQCQTDALEYFNKIENAIRIGQEKDEIKENIDPKEFTFFFFAFVFGIINNWLFFDQPFKLSEIGPKYLNNFIEFHLRKGNEK